MCLILFRRSWDRKKHTSDHGSLFDWTRCTSVACCARPRHGLPSRTWCDGIGRGAHRHHFGSSKTRWLTSSSTCWRRYSSRVRAAGATHRWACWGRCGPARVLPWERRCEKLVAIGRAQFRPVHIFRKTRAAHLPVRVSRSRLQTWSRTDHFHAIRRQRHDSTPSARAQAKTSPVMMVRRAISATLKSEPHPEPHGLCVGGDRGHR